MGLAVASESLRLSDPETRMIVSEGSQRSTDQKPGMVVTDFNSETEVGRSL